MPGRGLVMRRVAIGCGERLVRAYLAAGFRARQERLAPVVGLHLAELLAVLDLLHEACPVRSPPRPLSQLLQRLQRLHRLDLLHCTVVFGGKFCLRVVG